MLFGVFRKIRRAVLILVLVPTLLVALAVLFPQQMLCIDTGPVQADVLVVLGGGGGERAQRAAELYHAGEAPKIILTGKGDCRANRDVLEHVGVPRAVIHLECESNSTRENATKTAVLLKQMGARRVILVTSWYHSRRSFYCFRKYAPGIKVYSRPSYFGWTRLHQRREGITRYVQIEYLKIAGYWALYGVRPF